MKESFESILSEIKKAKNAFDFQESVCQAFEARGFTCSKEVKVPNRGDGRSGRIDIVASKDGFVIAIELDRLTARKKSIYKLKHFMCDSRLVFLRQPHEVRVIL